MSRYVKKTTKVFRNGKLIKTLSRDMTELQYNKDLAERLLQAQSGETTIKVKRASPWNYQLDGLVERTTDSVGGDRYRYETAYSYPVKRGSRKGRK